MPKRKFWFPIASPIQFISCIGNTSYSTAMAEGLAAVLSSVVPSCSTNSSSSFPVVRFSFSRIRQARPSTLHLISRGNLPHSLVLKRGDGRARQRKSLQVLCQEAANSTTTMSAGAKSISSKLVLVFGATGGVGQLVVASLLEKGAKVRALLRSAEKARSLLGEQLGNKFEVRIGDTRQREVLDESLFEGVTHVIMATGTTAFPSKRWIGDNGPEQTDWIGVRNIVDAVPETVERVVLLSSIGVTKYDKLPFYILNLFGVLKYKKMGEDHLRKSGLPFTILRPGRLTGGPYTSYDLNTLLKATAEDRDDLMLGQGDKLVGEAVRRVVAEACVHSLDLECTKGQTYELSSIKGEGPGKDAEKWASLFQAVHSAT